MKPYRPKVSQGMIKELVPFFPLVFLMAWMAAPIVVNIALYGIFIVGEIDIQSYLIWVEYGLSLTLTVWAVESFLVHRRNLTMIREWSVTASILSTVGGVILLLLSSAFYTGTLDFFQRLPQGCVYCPLILSPEFLRQRIIQQIIQPWTYAGIFAVVAGAISLWLGIKPHLYAALSSIGALSTSVLLFLGSALTITALGNVYIQPLYVEWFAGAAVSAILAATLILPVGVWRRKIQ